jgi:predicted tellurium resistance membrane protein TerC
MEWIASPEAWVALAKDVEVMIIAIVLAMLVMIFAAKAIGDFVDEHPTIKMLALSFLVLIGMALIGEGIDLYVPKGYIYFAMAFSLCVEMLNLRVRRHRSPVKLHPRWKRDSGSEKGENRADQDRNARGMQ